MVSVLRIVRQLRSESLEEVARACGIRKSTLSLLERNPNREISRRLKQRLEAHFQSNWRVLCLVIDAAEFSKSLLQSLERKQAAHV